MFEGFCEMRRGKKLRFYKGFRGLGFFRRAGDVTRSQKSGSTLVLLMENCMRRETRAIHAGYCSAGETLLLVIGFTQQTRRRGAY